MNTPIAHYQQQQTQLVYQQSQRSG